MDDVTDLAAERWARGSDASAHRPEDALAAALRDLRSGEIEVKHLVIAVAFRQSGADTTRFYQAGQYDTNGQLGLLARVGHLIAG